MVYARDVFLQLELSNYLIARTFTSPKQQIYHITEEDGIWSCSTHDTVVHINRHSEEEDGEEVTRYFSHYWDARYVSWENGFDGSDWLDQRWRRHHRHSRRTKANELFFLEMNGSVKFILKFCVFFSSGICCLPVPDNNVFFCSRCRVSHLLISFALFEFIFLLMYVPCCLSWIDAHNGVERADTWLNVQRSGHKNAGYFLFKLIYCIYSCFMVPPMPPMRGNR